MNQPLSPTYIGNGQKLTFSFGLCKTCILVSSIIIGQKCPFNTLLIHFPQFHFLFPTQFHFINILLFIFFYFTNIKLTFILFTIIKPTSKRWREFQMFNEGLSNYFARYTNFILLNSYLFLNLFEYEVNIYIYIFFWYIFFFIYPKIWCELF